MNNYKGDIDENNMKNLLKKIYLKLLLLKTIKFLCNENNYKQPFFTSILIIKIKNINQEKLIFLTINNLTKINFLI